MGCFYSKEFDQEVYDMSPVRHLPVIFVNGVPGAGNQTVAQTIANMTGYCMIKPGELLREEGQKDTPRGHYVFEKFSTGDEIPEQLTVDLIKEEMLLKQDEKGFILVGFPKNPRMSNIFRKQVKWPEKVVALEVDNDIAASRLQSKLSELGRPESEIHAARQIVRDAAHKVKNVHKRFGDHVITVRCLQLDSSGNPKALASMLKDILSDIGKDQQTKASGPDLPSGAPTASEAEPTQPVTQTMATSNEPKDENECNV